MKQKLPILIFVALLATSAANGDETSTESSDLQHQYPNLPSLSNCSYSEPLLYINQSVQKVICWVNMTVNQSMAAQLCQKFEMKLFTIETSEMFYKYQISTYSHFPRQKQNFFINARLNNNVLKTFTSPAVPVFSGYHWINNASAGCVVLSQESQGTYLARAISCNSWLTTFHCELQLPDPPTAPPTTPTTQTTSTVTKKSTVTTKKSTTTKQVKTTTQKPSNLIDLSTCNYTEDLYYPDKSYIKSICYMTDQFRQSTAAAVCADKNMKLFTIGSAKTFEAYKNSIYLHFQQKSEQKFFFNAKLANNVLKTYTDPKVNIYSNYKWIKEASNGCVWMIKTSTNDFMVQAVGCSTSKASFHCEYDSPVMCDSVKKSSTSVPEEEMTTEVAVETTE